MRRFDHALTIKTTNITNELGSIVQIVQLLWQFRQEQVIPVGSH